ncbi:hypothetical protein ACFO0S_04090 [Chryseomicrobium palamuruense]|uniref:Replicative DNA helicase n=1 Tax=Chryseomicrobium palamuruense TaxID=682973 RepID=A0ABV8UTW1_9BACL
MEKMDSRMISIFKEDDATPQLSQAMKDVSSLGGVLSELGAQEFFQSPTEILRFLRVIQLLNEEALGLGEPIENEEMIYYRYLNRYQDQEAPTKKRVEQIIYILSKYNWISKQSRRIKMRDLGKRMMDALIRLANDSLAYYLQDDIGKSLFQARRDAAISEAYDDNGISGGNKIASMIKNVEDAILLLRERELEMLADRNALPQLELIHSLMQELEQKLEERLNKFATFEESLVLTDLMQRGTGILAEGTNLSLGMINKYIKFSSIQKTPLATTIHPEKLRNFIANMFDPPVDSDIPNVYQMFSFMEQNFYEDEAVDGIWIPIKLASPLSAGSIDDAIDYLENYEPTTDPIEEDIDEVTYVTEEMSEEELEGLMAEANWMLTKQMIQTDRIEEYFKEHEQAPLEQVIVEATSSEWGDTINALTAVSALISSKKIVELPSEQTMFEEILKEWEWMKHEDGGTIIKRRTNESLHGK